MAGVLDSLTGNQGYRSLPQRVRDTIAAQQDASERLIGWFQLFIVLTFGTLYAIAPKTFVATDVPFQPVPWALGIYFVLTLIRLAWAHRGRLPGWTLALSIAVDMTLLMVLIWSFHLQYGQPPSFYLKAPTLLYVFIFIALRTLRFEAWYVAVAGVMAALGWGFMVGYAVWSEAGTMVVTRDYVKYLTSNSILIGAEFDKIITILLVSVILTAALIRARRLLVRSVADETARQDLSRFFAPEIAQRITGAEGQIRAGSGEARDAAILMVDVRGFTKLAATMPPDALIALLTEYESRMVPVIQAHGGSIDKFLGDGIMATFGAAQPVPDYAARAIAAAQAVIAECDAWNAERDAAGKPPVRIGCAVATGRIIFGAVGDRDRLEYTVIGDAVNLAAKLEKHNRVAGTRALATADALRLAQAQGAADATPLLPAPAQRIEGVERPLDLVVLAR